MLKDVDLDNTYEHTLDFDNEQVQAEYFASKKFTQVTVNVGFSYLRENLPITVEIPKDELFGCNYLMYSNESTGKWYYAFINKKDYVNETCTRLTIETDVMQTFMFDYDFVESFIDREHQDRATSENTPLYNVQKESIYYGEKYEQKSKQHFRNNTIERQFSDGNAIYIDGYFVVVRTEKLQGDTIPDATTDGNFLETPFYMYAFPFLIEKRTLLDGSVRFKQFPSTNNELLLKVGSGGTPEVMQPTGSLFKASELKATNTIALFYAPYCSSVKEITFENSSYVVRSDNMQKVSLSVGGTSKTFPCIRILQPENVGIFKTISKPASFDFSNISINNLKSISLETKLFTNPYYFLQLDNKQTTPLTILNEYLPENLELNIKSANGPQPKWIYYLKNYLSENQRIIDMTSTELPLMTNAWLEYLNSNRASATWGMAVNVGLNMLDAGLGIGMFAAGMPIGGIGTIAGSARRIASTFAQREDIKKTPDSVRHQGNNGLATLSADEFGMTLIEYSITEQFRQILFEYFYHYGYKCNEIKIPNLKSRYYFNFIQTVGCELKSNIDNQYIQMIKNIYDKGITIWHYRDANTFKGIGNYEYENAEMSLLGE